MNNEFKVAICSKGRYETKQNPDTGTMTYSAKMIGTIYRHAIDNDIKELDRVYLFVEPQEVEKYVENYPKWPWSNIVVLGGNDQGISFARQTVLNFFQDTVPTEFVFTLDDDLVLCEYQWKAHPKTGVMGYQQVTRYDVLQLLDEFIDHNKALPEFEEVGIASFNYNQFGWCTIKNFPANGKDFENFTGPYIYSNWSHSDCAVMLRPLLYKKLGIRYDAQAPLKEDRDLNAQVCYHGYYARKSHRYLMISPLNSTNKGGCSTFYKTEGYCKKSCDYLIEKWNKTYPGAELCKHQIKNTSYDRTFDVKWFWRRLYWARTQNKIKVEVETPDLFPEIIHNAITYSNYEKIR